MKDTVKISSIIKSQLPSYITDDGSYETFVSFLEAYYEWMESKEGVLYHSSNLPDYNDINTTLEQFIDHFYSEFMPSFPTSVLSDRRKLIKFSKELYESKGTKASYKFLFRVLYDSQTEIIETKDFVLRASDGKWFIPKSIKIKSNDGRFTKTKNLYIFGEDSKSLAKIERAKIVNDKIEIFISDVERLFNFDESVRIVDSYIRDVYFDNDGNIVSNQNEGEVLRARIVSSISSASIDKNRRGNYYLAGNPLVFYGGLQSPLTDLGAEGYISEVTAGSIKTVEVNVDEKNWGYRNPYTAVHVNPDYDRQTVITTGTLDPSGLISLDYIIKDSLELKENVILYCDPSTGYSTNVSANYAFAGIASANANTPMKDAFTFSSIDTYPLTSVIVQNGGGGYENKPEIYAESMYQTTLPTNYASSSYDARYDFDVANVVSMSYASLPLLGILAPIKITNGGVGYVAGDEILFKESVGSGAFARVDTVNATGAIESVVYYQKPDIYAPLGGFGYYEDRLPTITIQERSKTANTIDNTNIIIVNSDSPLSNIKIGQIVTGNGIFSNTTVLDINYANNSLILSNVVIGNYISNTYNFVGTRASLYVDGIMGGSAILNPTTDRIGAITNINITNYGEDYFSTPNVSLRIQDFAVSNINLIYPPQKGDIVYQGELSNVVAYKAYVDSISIAEANEDKSLSKFILRSYNYNIPVNVNDTIYLQKRDMEYPNTFAMKIEKDYIFKSGYYGLKSNKSGVVTYGDGTGSALAKFLNGLIIGRGRYISEQGHPSSYALLQNEDYNNYTYILSVEKEITKYRDILYDLLHPAGTKIIGQALIKSDVDTGILTYDNTFSNSLFDDYEFIFAGLTDEESTANLIQFQLSTKKYGKVLSNNEVQLYNFPGEVDVGQLVVADPVPYASVITNIDFANNYIVISNNCVSNRNVETIEIFDQTDYPDQGNTKPIKYYIKANTFIGSNVIHFVGNTSVGLDNIESGQIIRFNAIKIQANITNNSNILTNVNNFSNTPIYVGQTISAKNIPENTFIVAYYTGNNTIVMSNNATRTLNYTTSYYNNFIFDRVVVNNYINLYNTTSSNTRITSINKDTNIITLSSNCISSQDSVFHFMGDSSSIYGGNNYIILRTEPGAIAERSY